MRGKGGSFAVIDARSARIGGGEVVASALSQELRPLAEAVWYDRRHGSHPLVPLSLFHGQHRHCRLLRLSETAVAGGSWERIVTLAGNWHSWLGVRVSVSASAKRVIARLYGNRSSCIIAPSTAFADTVSWLCPRSRVEVMPYGVRSEFVSSVRQERVLQLVAITSASSHKRVGELIRLHDDVMRAVPGAVLVVCGVSARRASKEKWQGKNRVFEGQVDATRLAAVLGQSAAYVQVSSLETFSHPLVEALATGTPIFAPLTAVTREIVGSSPATVLTGRDNRSAADAVVAHLRDPDGWSRYETAQRLAAGHFVGGYGRLAARGLALLRS